jgi:hypothetical protein
LDEKGERDRVRAAGLTQSNIYGVGGRPSPMKKPGGTIGLSIPPTRKMGMNLLDAQEVEAGKGRTGVALCLPEKRGEIWAPESD